YRARRIFDDTGNGTYRSLRQERRTYGECGSDARKEFHATPLMDSYAFHSTPTSKYPWTSAANQDRRSAADTHGIQFNLVDVSGTSNAPVLVRSGVMSFPFRSKTNTSPLASTPS